MEILFAEKYCGKVGGGGLRVGGGGVRGGRGGGGTEGVLEEEEARLDDQLQFAHQYSFGYRICKRRKR